ncbi:MAG: hypothetical protein ACRCZI_11615, partial [Cetobacterium sp.]
LKEWRANKVLCQNSIRTVEYIDAGISINPCCKHSSYLVMKYIENVKYGKGFFINSNEEGRGLMLEQIAIDLSLIIKIGYVPRDIHLDNFLVDEDGKIIWIDTHLKKIPLFFKQNKINKCLSYDKFYDVKYRDILYEKLMCGIRG